MNNPYASKPWLKSYDKHVPEKLMYTDTPYVDLFREAVGQAKGSVAVYYAGIPVTMGELDVMSNKFANFLKEQGLKKGDVVGVNLPNVLAVYISALGAIKAGCVYSGVSPLLTPREIEYQLNNSETKVLVTLDVLWGTVRQAIGNTSVKTIVMVRVSDFLPTVKRLLGKLLKKIPQVEVTPVADIPIRDFMDIIKNAPATPLETNVGMDDNCLLIYTGGTTGIPKGAIVTHKSFLSMMTQLTNWMDNKIGKSSMLTAFPLFHGAGTLIATWAMVRGCTLIAVPNPRDIPSFIKSIKKYKPTILGNVPTIYMELLKHPAFSKCDFSNLEFSMSTAMPMAPEYVRLLESIIGEGKFVEAFGLTETLPVIAGPYYGKKKIGSLGLPLPDVEVKVVDPETGEIVPVGEHGELVIKGPQVFSKGYYNMPEETAKILKDGWVYTGDVVRMDEDGYFFIVDRTKDMINVSGYKVFSREMDDLISEHPAVAVVATIGTPNPDRPGAEIVTSAIVLKPGVEKSDSTKNSIIDFVKKNAAPYKVPKKIVFMDELPTSSVGKILKRELREMLKS